MSKPKDERTSNEATMSKKHNCVLARWLRKENEFGEPTRSWTRAHVPLPRRQTLPATDEIKEAKRAKLLKRMRRISPRFMLKAGVLYRLPHQGKRDVTTMKLVIPQVFQQEYLSLFHDLPLAGHMGLACLVHK